MKKLILLAMVGIAFTACNKEESYQFRTDLLEVDFVERPNCKYSVKEIVADMGVEMWYFWDNYGSPRYFDRSFSEEERDTINERLLMRAEDILTVPDGNLLPNFITAKNIYLTMSNGDTCGYIPNSVIASARAQIDELYAQEKYDEIYEVFRKAFTFYTCTGEEYKAIVKEGHK